MAFSLLESTSPPPCVLRPRDSASDIVGYRSRYAAYRRVSCFRGGHQTASIAHSGRDHRTTGMSSTYRRTDGQNCAARGPHPDRLSVAPTGPAARLERLRAPPLRDGRHPLRCGPNWEGLHFGSVNSRPRNWRRSIPNPHCCGLLPRARTPGAVAARFSDGSAAWPPGYIGRCIAPAQPADGL
jgi:hypothetical protein